MSLTSPDAPSDGLTESRFALYEGFIALAWADGALDVRERDELRALIDGNLTATPAQKAQLHAALDQPIAVEDVWPRLTEPQDRARLLDMASTLFTLDGVVCEDEQETGEAFLRRHLKSLDMDRIEQELSALREAQLDAKRKEAEALREYRKQFGLIAAFKRFFRID